MPHQIRKPGQARPQRIVPPPHALVQYQVRVRKDLGVESPRRVGVEEPLVVGEQRREGTEGSVGIGEQLWRREERPAGGLEDLGGGSGAEGVQEGGSEENVTGEVEGGEEGSVGGQDVEGVKLQEVSCLNLVVVAESIPRRDGCFASGGRGRLGGADRRRRSRRARSGLARTTRCCCPSEVRRVSSRSTGAGGRAARPRERHGYSTGRGRRRRRRCGGRSRDRRCQLR